MYFNKNGFTIIEIMITIMILGLILSIVTPNVLEIKRNYQLITITNDLSFDIKRGKSEAIKSNQHVSICGLSTTENCNSTDWSLGWKMFYSDNSGNPINNNSTIKVSSLNNDHLLINATGIITFNSIGFVNQSNIELSYNQNKRLVCVLISGQVYIENENC